MAQLTTDSLPFSPSRTVSWIHIGDLHMVREGEQNEIDLGRIVDEINLVFAHRSVDFVFLPGDIADDGSRDAYKAVRTHLDRLQLPWFGIVGDHDVHEESYSNFREFISNELFTAFSIGPYRFLRLNAFSTPRPDAFEVNPEQLIWLEKELERCENANQCAVLFLHCYPTDLKLGRDRLQELLQKYPVLLIDMGHTHYNEVSNDGTVLYSATRSTGQVEEGPVGYSLTTLDGDAVSWHFIELGSPELVAITQPADDRMVTKRIAESALPQQLCVRAKCWSPDEVIEVSASLGEVHGKLLPHGSNLWEQTFDIHSVPHGEQELKVVSKDTAGKEAHSSIRVQVGPRSSRQFAAVDQENSIGAWEDRGLLDTHLGPNKNGRKW